MLHFLKTINRILKNKNIQVTIALVSIIAISFLIKFSYVDLRDSVYSDAAEYQGFALNILYGQALPTGLHNIGYPVILFFLFKVAYLVTHYDNALFYSQIQRIFTVIISCATIPISYIFFRRFVNRFYSIIGCSMFAFEPHVTQNAALGITEPVYLFFAFVSLVTVTSQRKNLSYLAFVFASIATIIRFEGFMLFAVIILLFFTRYNKENHTVKKISLILVGFSLPIILFTLLNLHYGNHVNVFTEEIKKQIDVILIEIKHNFLHKLSNSIIYFGWSMFPMFIGLIPVGLLALWKKKDKATALLILSSITLLGSTGILAYLRAYDTRYFIHTYPFIIILCLLGLVYLEPHVKKYYKTNRNQKLENTILIGLILMAFAFVGFAYDNHKIYYSFTDENKNVTKANSTAVIYPTFTISAYDKVGFYTYYKGLCGTSCLRIDDKFNIIEHIKNNPQGLRTIENLGYPIITDRQLEKDPKIIQQYKTIIILHNEYVTQNEFDAINSHPNVIYLYPNALYAKVILDTDNSVILIRGHGYPNATISNGFNWKLDNGKYEGSPCSSNWKFYKVSNGYMLNCYPENIINKDPNLWLKINELAKR